MIILGVKILIIHDYDSNQMSFSIAFEPLRGHIIVNVMCVDDIILVQRLLLINLLI